MSRVLIQCGDNLENSVRVLSLATLLRDAGQQPVVMVYTRPYAAFFEQHGVEVAPLYPYRLAGAAAEAAWRFDFAWDPDDLIRLPARIATLSGDRFDRAGAVAAARRALVAVDRLVRDRGVERCVAWNGFTGAVADALRRFVAIKGGGFIERGLIPGGVIFDPQGANGDATLARGPAGPPDPDLDDRHGPALRRWFPQIDAAPAPAPQALLVPLQVQRDSNVALHAPFATMRRLLIEAARIRDAAFRGWDILVRPHPEESAEERLNLPRLAGASLTPGGGLGAWLDRGAVALTLNSTVGLEAAIAGRGAIALGEGVYCREPFVTRMDAPDDLRTLRERIEAQRADRPAQRAHVRAYLLRLLDGHQVQPAGATRTTPAALLRHFAAAPPRDARPAPLTFATQALGGPGATHSVHAIGMHDARFALDYRTPDAPLTRKAIAAALGATFGIDRRFDIAARDAPESGDIAIAGPGIDVAACAGYRVVLDARLSLHAGWLAAIAPGGRA